MKRLHTLPIMAALLLGGCDGVTLEDSGTTAQELNADALTLTTKVINGTPVSEGVYPWITGLFHNYGNGNGYNYRNCGGSLISERWVLTAAHCVVRDDGITPMKANTLYVTVGSTDLTSQNLDYIGVDQIIVHPDYLGLNLWPTNDDIALVQLESAPGNEAISIPRWKSTPEEGETVTVAGWGRTDVDTSIDESELREADMVVRTENRCHPWYDSNTHIDGKESAIRLDHDLIACAGGTAENVTQACFGDSGSPMFVTRQDGEIVQAGVVSGGWGDCGTGGIPGLYTKVAAYQSWIRSEMTPTSLYKGGSDEVKITAEEDQADWVNMKNFSSSTATLDVGEIARYRLPETSRVRVKTLRGNTGLIVYDHWSMDQNDIVCSADTEWSADDEQSNAYYVDPGEGEGEWEICDLDSEDTYFARVISWDDSRYRIRKD